MCESGDFSRHPSAASENCIELHKSCSAKFQLQRWRDAFHWRTHSPCASWILCYWQKLVLIRMSYTIHWYFRAKSDGLVISKKWFVFRWNHKSAAVLMPGLMWRCAKRSRGRTFWGRRLVSHRIFLILMPFLALVMSERGLSRLSTCGIFERWHVDSGLCVYTVMYVFYS